MGYLTRLGHYKIPRSLACVQANLTICHIAMENIRSFHNGLSNYVET